MPMRRSGIVIFILFGMTRSVFAQLSQLSKEDMDTPAARVKGMGAPVKADRLYACSRESHSMPNWTCRQDTIACAWRCAVRIQDSSVRRRFLSI